MNNSISFWERAALQASTLLRKPACHVSLSSVRNVCIVKRLYPPKKQDPSIPLLERTPLYKKSYIYSLQENTLTKKQGEMTVLLKYDIEGLGMKGDVLPVAKRLARSILLPAEVAEYASPENLKKNEESKLDTGTSRQSIWAQKTRRQLENMHLPIAMNSMNKWTLSATHVKVAFRRVGVELNEDHIILPDEAINESGPVKFSVKINNAEEVPVQGTIYPWTPDERHRPTEEIWTHQKVSILDAVLDIVKKNNSANIHGHEQNN